MHIDDDRNFKTLISLFFFEFLDAFLPDVAAFVEKDAGFELLDKELFTNRRRGRRHADLAVKVKFRGDDTFFLIHIEAQGRPQHEFGERMLFYDVFLMDKYRIKVYPIALFTHATPNRAEPNVYEVAFPNKTVLKFHYDVIQLNRIPWRKFLDVQNPASTALMAKMDIPVRDRPKVRSECFRMLATLRLDAAKSKVIGAFIDSYLTLTERESLQFTSGSRMNGSRKYSRRQWK
jgi:hypothetical protein